MNIINENKLINFTYARTSLKSNKTIGTEINTCRLCSRRIHFKKVKKENFKTEESSDKK